MLDIPKEELEGLYVIENKTMKEIAQHYGVSYSTIRLRITQYGIPKKEPGNYKDKEYHIIPYNRKDIESKYDQEFSELYNNFVSYKELSKRFNVSTHAVERKVKELQLSRNFGKMMSRDQYDDTYDETMVSLYNDGKSTTEIGKIIGLEHTAVTNHLRRSGIKIRTLSESQFAHNNKEYPKDLCDYEKLYDMYVINKMSKKEIALTIGVSPNVIDRALKHFCISVRGCSEARKGLYTGKSAGRYIDGRTPLYMRLRTFFRTWQVNPVLKRDHRTCQLCGSHKNLQVHHIIPFKNIFNDILSEHQHLSPTDNADELYDIATKDDRMNNLDNLITYCKDCHLFKIHGYRKPQ